MTYRITSLPDGTYIIDLPGMRWYCNNDAELAHKLDRLK